MAIDLNQFAPNEKIAGLYAYQANLPQLHNVIVSANQATALTYGAVVTLDSAVSNVDAPVVKQAAVTDNIFGVIVYDPRKAQFVSGERVALARKGDIIWMQADGAIAQGATLGFTSANKVTSTLTSGYAIIGKAITSAADGDFVQVELDYSKSPNEVDLSGYLTSSAAAETYQAKLTAGDFVDITDNTITTTYTAGTGIAISDEGAISVDNG